MALVQSKGGASPLNASIAISLPGATTAGNTILIFANGAGTITTPSGFTSRSPQVNVQGFYLFEKLVATGNSTDTPTLTMSGAFNATWQCVEYSGISAFDVSSGNNLGAGQPSGSKATPSITPTSGARLLVAGAAATNNSTAATFTAGDPQSWTNSFVGEQSNQQTGGAGSGNDSIGSGFADRSGVTGDGVTTFATAATFTSAGNAFAPATIIASYKVTAAAATTLGKTPPSIFRPSRRGPTKGLTATQAFPVGITSTPVNVDLSGLGVQATSTAGTVTVQAKASADLSGQGVAATSTANIPTVTGFGNVTLTGVVSTSAAGIPTVTGFANVSLTGVAASGLAGTPTVGVTATVSLTGVASASAAGTPTETGFANVTLTGVLGTGLAGTPTVTGFANVSINGVAATSSANIPTVTGFANVSLTGVQSAGAAGIPTVTGLANVTLTGVASASQIGTISVTVGGAVNVNLTGVEAASAAGTPTVTGFANVSLTGNAATGSAGTISTTAAANVTLTGVASASAANTPTITGAANVSLSGVAATGTAADITVSVPTSVSVSLLGVQSNIVVGTLSTNLDVVNTDGQTILTDRRGAGGFSRKQYDEFVKAKRAALARKLKKKPATELRLAVELAEQAVLKAGLLGEIAPSLEPLIEALQDADTVATAQQAARVAQLLLAQMEDDDEDDIMILLSTL